MDHTIGEFAQLTGLIERALRLYEDKGLLAPDHVDPATGYRWYAEQQVADGRLVAMLRAVDMPLATISEVLQAPVGHRSAIVGRYWYDVERRLDERRRVISTLREHTEQEEHGMSHSDNAAMVGASDGPFAALRALAGITDPSEIAAAHREAMKKTYWDAKDLTLSVAFAYAGISRMLAIAEGLADDDAYAARSEAKAMLYDLASFSWPGWDEPGIHISPTDAEAGLSAARSNLALALELDKPDLAVSRAHWMLGAHLLTAGEFEAAIDEFESAAKAADRAAADPEIVLYRAFAALAALARGDAEAANDLETALERFGPLEHGDMFREQVETARRVLGV